MTEKISRRFFLIAGSAALAMPTNAQGAPEDKLASAIDEGLKATKCGALDKIYQKIGEIITARGGTVPEKLKGLLSVLIERHLNCHLVPY